MEKHEVIIIGSGPAGYTAAIYLGRSRLAPLLFSGKEIGGQLMYTTEVENYPGFSEGVVGPKLMMEMRKQAKRFETTVIDRLVDSVEKTEGGWIVRQAENEYFAKAVLITTGAQARRLGLSNEDAVFGHGLSVCAVCDAAFYGDKKVVVVGGGDSAMEDALALTKYASHVTLVHRRDSFRASKIMQERVLNHPKITVRWNTTVTEIFGQETVTGVKLQDTQTGQTEEVMVNGLFYAIGHIPATQFLGDLVKKNNEGYIITRLGLDKESLELAQQNLDEGNRLLFATMTSQEGMFAAGDCVDFRYRQAVTAAAFGTMAALDIERWLETHA